MKRVMDALIAAAALAILSPALAAVALAVRINLGTPVFFRQERPGLHGRPFCLVKFRTMRHSAGPDWVPLPDEQRLTRFGRFLRASSLDELPELWNVLRGDMSLVGPRPLLVKYLPCYTPRERRRHDVRPGITGWAQVNGRNRVSWSERLEMDVWYVENRSLLLDLRILLLTLRSVTRRKGLVVDPRSIMLDLDEERAHLAERA